MAGEDQKVAVIDPTPKARMARAPVPVCPYCGQDPCLPDLIEMTSGKYITKIACCDNAECRKIFGVQIVGEKPQQIIAPGAARR